MMASEPATSGRAYLHGGGQQVRMIESASLGGFCSAAACKLPCTAGQPYMASNVGCPFPLSSCSATTARAESSA